VFNVELRYLMKRRVQCWVALSDEASCSRL